MEQKDSRFAVLIDADNVSPKYIKYILDVVGNLVQDCLLYTSVAADEL